MPALGASRPVDVLVLGGGPAGSSVAALLAAEGLRVVLCERQRHPRFHVGESLLPASAPLLKRLGVWDDLAAGGYQRKWGAHFLFEPERVGSRIEFARGLDPASPMAFQVRRASFDHLLLRRAAARGVEVREGVEALAVLFRDGRATGARVRDEAGGEDEIAATVVVDATGRDTLLGRQLGTRARDPVLAQAALFSHFQGGRLGMGREGGDILIVGAPVGWFWMIPLDAETASVGVVFPGSVMRERRGRSLADFYAGLIAGSPEVAGRLAGARRVEDVHPLADFSYRLRRFGGDGFVVVGDAAAFLDPVFSSGVHVALSTAARAAREVAAALGGRGRLDGDDLVGYERFARAGLDHFRRYILGFYDPAFVSVFAGEPPFEFLRSAVVTALGGGVFEPSRRQRLLEGVFFWGVEREARRIARGEVAPPTAPACERG